MPVRDRHGDLGGPSTPLGLVLAGGGSRRFGEGDAKLRATFRGRPLVCWAVDAARRALDEVVVVAGAVDLRSELGPEVEVVRHPDWSDGLASSLRCGLDEADRRGHDTVVVGLADQPLVPAEAWARVAARDSPVATATYGGRPNPPVRLARSVWDLLPMRGEVGARELIRRRPDLVEEVPCPGRPDDVDTRTDLESLEKNHA